jgi:hypothetical protein
MDILVALTIHIVCEIFRVNSYAAKILNFEVISDKLTYYTIS